MITDSDSATLRDDLADDIVSSLTDIIDADTMLSAGFSALQTNGDFETGDLTGWTAVGNAGMTAASTDESHGGDYSCAITNSRTFTIANGDFETGDTTGYTTDIVGGSITITDSTSHAGDYSAHIIGGSKTGNRAVLIKAVESHDLVAGDTFSIEAYTKGTASASTSIRVYTNEVSAENLIGTAAITSTADWTKFTAEATIPSDVTPETIYIVIYCIINNNIYVDDIAFSIDYASGRTQNVTLTSSATFTATCYAKMSEIDTTYRMRLSWTDGTGAHTEDATFEVSDDWAAYTLTANIGAGLTGTSTLSFFGTGAGYVDDITLIRTRTTAELADIMLPGNGVFRRGGMTESEQLVLPQHKMPAWIVHVGPSTSSIEGTWGIDEQDYDVTIEWLLTTVDVDTAAQEANQALSKLVRWWRKIDQRTAGYGDLVTLMTTGDGEVISGPDVDAPIWGANGPNDGDTIDYAMVGSVTCTVRLRVARS